MYLLFCLNFFHISCPSELDCFKSSGYKNKYLFKLNLSSINPEKFKQTGIINSLYNFSAQKESLEFRTSTKNKNQDRK